MNKIELLAEQAIEEIGEGYLMSSAELRGFAESNNVDVIELWREIVKQAKEREV